MVNTHGWIKGLGLDLLTDVLRLLQPSHVICLQGTNPRNNLPPGPFWLDRTQQQQQSCVVLQLPGAPLALPGPEQQQLAPSRSATDTRAELWLRFTRACSREPGASQPGSSTSLPAGQEGSSESRWAAAARRLAAERPYRVAVGQVQLRFLFGSVPAGEELRAVNGALVGLCSSISAGGPPLCLGHGLVRAVDASRGLLFLVTDVPREQLLSSCDLLMVGRLELPGQLLQADDMASPYVAPNCLAAEGTGAGIQRSRNNLMRMSQAAKA